MNSLIRLGLLIAFGNALMVMHGKQMEEMKRQGRETRRLVVEMQYANWFSCNKPLAQDEVRFDDNFIITNVVDGAKSSQ